MAHQLARYREAGMDGCVAKPIEAVKLMAALSEAMSLRSADQPDRAHQESSEQGRDAG
jgi:hypothetical protein